MNLTKYWGWQAELDRNILETHNLVENEELLQKKILALNVELGELANEWRGFKFWSNKPSSSKDVILGEWVDCLHFTLSIGNQIGQRYNVISLNFNSNPLDSFRNVFSVTSLFTEDHYRDLLTGLLELAHSLGLKNDEIEAAYLSKNETNHKRQEEGY